MDMLDSDDEFAPEAPAVTVTAPTVPDGVPSQQYAQQQLQQRANTHQTIQPARPRTASYQVQSGNNQPHRQQQTQQPPPGIQTHHQNQPQHPLPGSNQSHRQQPTQPQHSLPGNQSHRQQPPFQSGQQRAPPPGTVPHAFNNSNNSSNNNNAVNAPRQHQQPIHPSNHAPRGVGAPPLSHSTVPTGSLPTTGAELRGRVAALSTSGRFSTDLWILFSVMLSKLPDLFVPLERLVADMHGNLAMEGAYHNTIRRMAVDKFSDKGQLQKIVEYVRAKRVMVSAEAEAISKTLKGLPAVVPDGPIRSELLRVISPGKSDKERLGLALQWIRRKHPNYNESATLLMKRQKELVMHKVKERQMAQRRQAHAEAEARASGALNAGGGVGVGVGVGVVPNGNVAGDTNSSSNNGVMGRDGRSMSLYSALPPDIPQQSHAQAHGRASSGGQQHNSNSNTANRNGPSQVSPNPLGELLLFWRNKLPPDSALAINKMYQRTKNGEFTKQQLLEGSVAVAKRGNPAVAAEGIEMFRRLFKTQQQQLRANAVRAQQATPQKQVSSAQFNQQGGVNAQHGATVGLTTSSVPPPASLELNRSSSIDMSNTVAAPTATSASVTKAKAKTPDKKAATKKVASKKPAGKRARLEKTESSASLKSVAAGGGATTTTTTAGTGSKPKKGKATTSGTAAASGPEKKKRRRNSSVDEDGKKKKAKKKRKVDSTDAEASGTSNTTAFATTATTAATTTVAATLSDAIAAKTTVAASTATAGAKKANDSAIKPSEAKPTVKAVKAVKAAKASGNLKKTQSAKDVKINNAKSMNAAAVRHENTQFSAAVAAARAESTASVVLSAPPSTTQVHGATSYNRSRVVDPQEYNGFANQSKLSDAIHLAGVAMKRERTEAEKESQLMCGLLGAASLNANKRVCAGSGGHGSVCGGGEEVFLAQADRLEVAKFLDDAAAELIRMTFGDLKELASHRVESEKQRTELHWPPTDSAKVQLDHLSRVRAMQDNVREKRKRLVVLERLNHLRETTTSRNRPSMNKEERNLNKMEKSEPGSVAKQVNLDVQTVANSFNIQEAQAANQVRGAYATPIGESSGVGNSKSKLKQPKPLKIIAADVRMFLGQSTPAARRWGIALQGKEHLLATKVDKVGFQGSLGRRGMSNGGRRR